MKLNRDYIEHEEKWRELTFQIPILEFRPEWGIRIIPPFGGALVRFIVYFKGLEVSVYLDWYNTLGSYNDEPYWELYPDANGGIERFNLNNHKELINRISESFIMRLIK